MDEYGVEPIESVDPTATGNSKRVRRVHVAALAGAVVVLVVAAVFAVQTTMDRGEAERAHRRAVHTLQARTRRHAYRGTRPGGSPRRSTRGRGRAHRHAGLGSGPRHPGRSRPRCGAARPRRPARPIPLRQSTTTNVAVARADAIIDQYNATLDILEQQIATLGNGGANATRVTRVRYAPAGEKSSSWMLSGSRNTRTEPYGSSAIGDCVSGLSAASARDDAVGLEVVLPRLEVGRGRDDEADVVEAGGRLA